MQLSRSLAGQETRTKLSQKIVVIFMTLNVIALRILVFVLAREHEGEAEHHFAFPCHLGLSRVLVRKYCKRKITIYD